MRMIPRLLSSYIILILYALPGTPCLAVTSQGEWAMQAKADVATLRIGEQTTLHITLTARNAEGIDFSSPILPKEIEILSFNVIDSGQEGDEQTWQADYIVTCFAPDSYQFQPAFAVAGDSIRAANVVSLNVQSVDLPQGEQPRDPHALIEQPLRLSRTFVALLLMFLLTTMMLLHRYKVRKKISEKQSAIQPLQPQQPALTPAAEAIRAINALREREHELDSDAYYTQLSAILRLYIDRRFNIHALQQTSSQIVKAIEQAAQRETLAELQEVLRTADLAKFARHELTLNEQAGSLLQALAFVEKTTAKPHVSVKPEEQSEAHSNLTLARKHNPEGKETQLTQQRMPSANKEKKTDWPTVALLAIDVLLALTVCPYLFNLFKLIFA